MCKACKMDEADTKRLRTRQGAVEIEDFNEELRYRHTKRRKKKKKTRPGCPGNDMQEHVYIWSTEMVPENYLFYKFYGWHSVEWNVCCGCGKRIGSRSSEKYEKFKERMWVKVYGKPEDVKRGEPVSRYGRNPRFRWWRPEDYDPKFVEFKQNYINQHGFTETVYGPFWWS